MRCRTPPSFHQILRSGNKRNPWSHFLLLSLVSLGLNGCYQKYYKVHTADKISETAVRHYLSDEKYFILHASHIAYALSDMEVKQDTLYANIDSLLTVHTKYLRPPAQERNRFPSRDELFVLMEVHLYTNDSVRMHTNVGIPLNHLNRMDVYSLDKGPTSTSAVISTVGITATTVGVIVLIVAAISISESGF